MSRVNLLVLRFVQMVAGMFWAGGQSLFTSDAPFANTNEALFSSVVYKKL